MLFFSWILAGNVGDDMVFSGLFMANEVGVFWRQQDFGAEVSAPYQMIF